MEQTFYSQLDALYAQGKVEEAEDFLTSLLDVARAADNQEDQITVLNELMGFYREQGNFSLCLHYCGEVLDIAESLHMEGTLPYATILLNVANAYRVMEKLNEAEVYFLEVQQIYSRHLMKDDYRVASLCNNLALVYRAQGEYEMAVRYLEQALRIIEKIPEAFIEAASTYTNLADIMYETGDTKQASEYLERAVKIYQTNNATSDLHYAAALSALAHSCFDSGDYPQALKNYREAAGTIEKSTGKTRNYAVMYKNIAATFEKMGQQAEAALALSEAEEALKALA